MSARTRSIVRYPMRSFPSDLAVQAGVVNALTALTRRGRAAAANGGSANLRAARRLAERMRNRRAQLAKDAGAGDAHLAGISLALHRRMRRRGRDHLQRISAARRSLRAREARHAYSRSAPRAGSAGASARRSARSLPRLINSWSRPSATAPTCSPIRWSRTGSRANHDLPILAVVFNNSRYGAVRRATLVDVQGRRLRRKRRPQLRRPRSRSAL